MGDSKSYFGEVADQWDRMRTDFFSESLRDKALDHAGVVRGELAADIGAGSGFMTEGLLARGLRVIAVDQSPEMLGVMRRKFGDGGGVDCRLGESERLPVALGEVDHVFANMYLHHVEHPATTIAEMARITRPGGRVVITDLDSHDFTFLASEHHDRWLGFARDDVRQWLAAAGLHDIVVDCASENCCARSACTDSAARISIFMASGRKQQRGRACCG